MPKISKKIKEVQFAVTSTQKLSKKDFGKISMQSQHTICQKRDKEDAVKKCIMQAKILNHHFPA